MIWERKRVLEDFVFRGCHVNDGELFEWSQYKNVLFNILVGRILVPPLVSNGITLQQRRRFWLGSKWGRFKTYHYSLKLNNEHDVDNVYVISLLTHFFFHSAPTWSNQHRPRLRKYSYRMEGWRLPLRVLLLLTVTHVVQSVCAIPNSN